MSTAATTPTQFQTTKVHVAAHLLARGEPLVSFDEATGVFTFPASAADIARRLERAPKRISTEDRHLFEKGASGRLRRK